MFPPNFTALFCIPEHFLVCFWAFYTCDHAACIRCQLGTHACCCVHCRYIAFRVRFYGMPTRCIHSSILWLVGTCWFMNWPPYTEGKENPKGQTTPDGWAAGLINKGAHIQGLSWVATRWVDLCTTRQNLQPLYRGFNLVHARISPDGLNNLMLSQGFVLETVPTVGTVGRTYIPRTGGAVGPPCLHLAQGSTGRSHALDDLFEHVSCFKLFFFSINAATTILTHAFGNMWAHTG